MDETFNQLDELLAGLGADDCRFCCSSLVVKAKPLGAS
jgi:hypothetical protein